MNSAQKFVSTETTIRRYLGLLADAETSYKAARIEEITEKRYKSKPFSKARSTSRYMKQLISKLRLIESTHNRYAKPNDYIEMVERIIMEEPVFVHSKELLEEINMRSQNIKAGIERAKEAATARPFMGGYSPTAALEDKKARMEQAKEMLLRGNAQDDSINAFLNNAYPANEENENDNSK